MYDPFERQIRRKEELRSFNLIRNKLQLQARDIESRAYKMLSNVSSVQQCDVSELIGEISGYIELRSQLCPDIAQDGYSGSLSGLMGKLKQMRSTI